MPTITTSDWRAAPAAADRPFVAIGDVHGAAGPLDALLTSVRRSCDNAAVFLGDLIDPSPLHATAHNCARVADLVAGDVQQYRSVVLVGNHDSMLLIALACAREGTAPPWRAGAWRAQGGTETAAAWGIDAAAFADETALASAIWRRMGPAQRAVFEGMRNWHDIGRYLFVHAGFRPDLPLAAQQARAKLTCWPEDRQMHHLWMRFASTEDVAPRGRILVHGHAPAPLPILGARRICIDTNAKSGGPLTALEVDGKRMRVHQAWSSAPLTAGHKARTIGPEETPETE